MPKTKQNPMKRTLEFIFEEMRSASTITGCLFISTFIKKKIVKAIVTEIINEIRASKMQPN